MTSPPARSRQGHGKRACYVAGCREPQCQAANSAYMQAWRASNPGYILNRRVADRPPAYQERRRRPNGGRE
jgi:hypothetical protein